MHHFFAYMARMRFIDLAQGADLYFCQAVLDLRQRHPEVTLEAVSYTHL